MLDLQILESSLDAPSEGYCCVTYSPVELDFLNIVVITCTGPCSYWLPHGQVKTVGDSCCFTKAC
jgi:hypothetical protein